MREVAEREAIDVYVGLPRSLSGAEGRAAGLAREYAGQLAARLRAAGSPVAVRLVDERLSTVAAHRSLRDAGMAGRKQRAVVDQAAAVVLLQAALDAERSDGRSSRRTGRPGTLVRCLTATHSTSTWTWGRSWPTTTTRGTR